MDGPISSNESPQVSEELPPERVFELLSDRVRLAVLDVLSARRGQMTVGDLAGALVEREPAPNVADEFEEAPAQLRIALVHTHLPKLADAAVVEYDADETVVAPTDRLEQVDPYVSLATDADSCSE